MSNHQCPTCNRKFGKKSHLVNHLNKKFKCQPLIKTDAQNIANNNLVQQINTQSQKIDTLVQENNTQIPAITNPQIPTIIPIIEALQAFLTEQQIPVQQKEQEIKDNKQKVDDEFACNFCNKSFSKNCTLRRHIKYYCKDKIEQDNKIAEANKIKQELFDKLMLVETEKKQLEEEIKNKDKQCDEKINKLMEEIKVLQSSIIINNNSNNTNTINNTININITSHGQEDLGKCADSFLVLAAKKGMNSVLTLTEWIHFNERFPEFQNIYIPDIKNKHVMVFDNVWQLKNTDEVIAKLYDNKSTFLNDNKEFLFNHLTEPEKKVYKRWEDYDNNRETPESKIFMKEAHERIKLLLYNKKDMVIATKKLHELKKNVLQLKK